MIEAQSLSRKYGDFTAVDGVSFAVDEGEIVGILGPNGAGKTTTIRMITGFLPPTSGRVMVGGKDLFEDPIPARRQIGYLPENVALYTEMRVGEYLAYRAALEGMSRADARKAIADAVERCLLSEVAHQIIGTLSKGYRQRVGLATAILHQPDVLVLDEPTVGLDPKQIVAIRELIRELGESRTLLLSTHILPEVELLCNRVLIIDRGRIIDQGTPDRLRERWRGNPVLRVTIKGAPAEAPEALAGLAGVLTCEPEGEEGGFRVECQTDVDLREAVFRLAVARGWVLLELAERKASLEDIFVRLTTRDLAVEPAMEGGAA
ncbi:MAG TPA: ATP-binding cassette domain-containing protein [Thermoanaerobaculia bacterium]|nr:ATP-binding cassette domain-containing protein [Thermoanaerobaculia bacterium]